MGSCVVLLSKYEIEDLFYSSHDDGDCAQLVIRGPNTEIILNNGTFKDDSLVNVYSLSKAIVTLAIYSLEADGVLCRAKKVSTYWPEFEIKNKKNITISNVLSHSSGIPYFGENIVTEDQYNWGKIISIIENTSPLHMPGEKNVYHARTYGYILGEIAQRICGISLNNYVFEKLSSVSNCEFYFGINEESIRNRIIPLRLSKSILEFFNKNDNLIDIRNLAFTDLIFKNPVTNILAPNNVDWISAQIPSSGGISNAISIVKIISNFFRSNFNVSSCFRKNLDRNKNAFMDYGLGFPVRWLDGFIGNSGEFGKGVNRIGFRAIGGGLFFYDMDLDIYFCYTPATMIPQLGRHPAHDPRIVKLIGRI